MSALRRCTLLAVLAAVVALPAGAAQAARPHTVSICLPVRATGVGRDLGGGRTQATISSHGVVLAQSNASFALGPVVGTAASFTGSIAFTAVTGTLTAQVAGSFDVATGAFHATSTSITATGRLHGVTGTVTLTGLEDLATGGFTETISGRLCRTIRG